MAEVNTTPTELGYLSGVTSAVQTQIAGKITQNNWSTFSPTLTSSNGGDTIPVYSTNTGRYVTIGKTVFCIVALTDDGGAEGNGSGSLRVNLPVAAGTNYSMTTAPIGRSFNSSTDKIIYGSIAALGTFVTLNDFDAAGAAFTGLTPTEQNNISRGIFLQFWYEID